MVMRSRFIRLKPFSIEMSYTEFEASVVEDVLMKSASIRRNIVDV